jgi:raffinose/stachyose/melibiose transport system permease protein
LLINRRNKMIGVFMILPVIVLYTIFFFYPVLQAIVDSFFEYNGVSEKTFNGLENYDFIFSQSSFLVSIKNTLVVMLVSLFVQLPVALLLAVLLNTEFKGFRFFRTVYFIPCIISTVVIGIMWSLIYDPYMGSLNKTMEMIGLGTLTQNWLGDPDIALGSINVVNVWQWEGYLVVILLAGLKGIPNEIIEAAKIDGANSFQRFIHITIPSLKWTFQVCILLVITGALKIFDLVYVMTGGGPGDTTEVMATYMWKISFISEKFGAGNAVAVVILIMSFFLTFISRRFAKED